MARQSHGTSAPRPLHGRLTLATPTSVPFTYTQKPAIHNRRHIATTVTTPTPTPTRTTTERTTTWHTTLFDPTSTPSESAPPPSATHRHSAKRARLRQRSLSLLETFSSSSFLRGSGRMPRRPRSACRTFPQESSSSSPVACLATADSTTTSRERLARTRR